VKGIFPEKIAKKFLFQIVRGCTALYAERIVHRDLKLDNILVHFPRFKDRKLKNKDLKAIDLAKEEFVIKICDLGYSRTLDDQDLAKSNCGSPLQMAPEFYFSRDGYDHKVDVWALGALYYTLLTSTHAFNSRDIDHLR
jgi:serine/threonine protein kinase